MVVSRPRKYGNPSVNSRKKSVRAPLEKPAPVEQQTALPKRSSVAKVSHTLSIALAERLEEFAFFQKISESAVIEHSLQAFFHISKDDVELGDLLRRNGAGRRRKP